LEDPCKDISCKPKCEGSIRHYDGKCENGTCKYATEECEFGCSNGTCKEDPCKEILCQPKCINDTFYEGKCIKGECIYEDGEKCIFGCNATTNLCNDKDKIMVEGFSPDLEAGRKLLEDLAKSRNLPEDVKKELDIIKDLVDKCFGVKACKEKLGRLKFKRSARIQKIKIHGKLRKSIYEEVSIHSLGKGSRMIKEIPKKICEGKDCIITINCTGKLRHMNLSFGESLSCGVWVVKVLEEDPVIAFTIEKDIPPEETQVISYYITPEKEITNRTFEEFNKEDFIMAPSYVIGDNYCSEGESGIDCAHVKSAKISQKILFIAIAILMVTLITALALTKFKKEAYEDEDL
jgi:hypothetical protein